jgi:hypothetical protein
MSDAARRAVALGGAIAMIGVAMVARNRLDDSGGSSDGGGGESNGTRTLVCPPELEDACMAVATDADVEVRIEDPTATADALSTARRAAELDGDTDLWLTTKPWIESVQDARKRTNLRPLLGQATDPIARSPVMLVIYDDAAAALESGPCQGAIGWRCVGEAADQQWRDVGGDPTWGSVKIGLTDPSSASGLVVLGGAGAGFLGSADYASNDFDGGLVNWLQPMVDDSSAARDPRPLVTRMLTGGRGTFAAVGATEVTAREVAKARRDDVRVLMPDPQAVASLVVVPIGDDPDDGAAEDLAGEDTLLDALATQGWRVPDHDLAEGIDPALDLPRDDGVPQGAVLRALLDRWTGL